MTDTTTNRLGVCVGVANAGLGVWIALTPLFTPISPLPTVTLAVTGVAIAALGATNAWLALAALTNRGVAGIAMVLAFGVTLAPAAFGTTPLAMWTLVTVGTIAAALAGVNLVEGPDVHPSAAARLA